MTGVAFSFFGGRAGFSSSSRFRFEGEEVSAFGEVAFECDEGSSLFGEGFLGEAACLAKKEARLPFRSDIGTTKSCERAGFQSSQVFPRLAETHLAVIAHFPHFFRHWIAFHLPLERHEQVREIGSPGLRRGVEPGVH